MPFRWIILAAQRNEIEHFGVKELALHSEWHSTPLELERAAAYTNAWKQPSQERGCGGWMLYFKRPLAKGAGCQRLVADPALMLLSSWSEG